MWQLLVRGRSTSSLFERVSGSRVYTWLALIGDQAKVASGIFATSLLSLAILIGASPTSALAQPLTQTSIKPDANGIDLVSGTFNMHRVHFAIGNPAAGGLVYSGDWIGWGWPASADANIYWRDNVIGTINSSGSTYTVSVGASTEEFTLSSGVFTSSQAVGSSLTFNSGTQKYSYTTVDGTVVTFDKALAGGILNWNANEGRMSSIALPDGQINTYNYKSATFSGSTVFRLQSVTNNLGYQIHFDYLLNNPANFNDLLDWYVLVTATGINNAIDYCGPLADTCSGLTVAWPYATFGMTGSYRSITDNNSSHFKYYSDDYGYMVIQNPASSTDNKTITPDGSGRASTVVTNFGTWSYSYADVGTTRTLTITDPNSNTRVVVSNQALKKVTSDTDAAGHTVSYTYDGYGRLTRVTQPEGNYAELTLDLRGNVTQIREVAKSGSGLSDIVTSASYPSSCTNPATCNLPTSTTDPLGNVTDYTYDATHGGVATVTMPAPGSGLARPQNRLSYTASYAYFKNSGGSIMAATAPVYVQTGVSACSTGASCSGASSEQKTTIVYGSTGVANNLLPTSLNSGAGDGSLIATTTKTYDAVGNLLTIDGPLAGTSDVVRYRYDGGRRLIGIVGPDPDSGGSLKNRAVRYTYDADGRATAVEVGTVNSQSDGDWSAFSPSQERRSDFDVMGRLTSISLIASGSPQAIAQFSYDNANRKTCSTTRMNPSTFGTLPTSACTLATAGTFGEDRITKLEYDVANRQSKIISAFGTAAAFDDSTTTRTNNGRVATVTDGNGNKTTFEYDGFDRLSKTWYPSPSTAGSSSTTDYEQFTYDAASRLTQLRRRDGQNVYYSHDNLGRISSGALGATYGYDNLGRQTSVSLSGVTISNVWDALGRRVSETTALGTISYQYDLANRRTRLTWPDTYYITYEYDNADGLTNIKESGSTSLISYAYDDLARIVSISRANGATTTYGLDAVSQITTIAHDLSGSGDDQTLTYTYNPAGQIMSRAGSNANYDHPAATTGTRTYNVNGLNQMTTAGSASLSYDSRGNLSSDGINSYTFNVLNQLTSLSGVTVSYDLSGRLSQVASSSTTKLLYDGGDLIAEYSSGGTVLRRYIHGRGQDEPLVWLEGSGTSDRRWLATDQNGSVISVTGASGSSLGINTYDEYGTPGSSNIGRFQYTGQSWVSEVGLYNYKARMYSPTIGRFMQTDPIGYDDGLNVYRYVGGDPINKRDPSGLSEQNGGIGDRPSDSLPGWCGGSYSRCLEATTDDADGGTVEELVVTGTRRGKAFGGVTDRNDSGSRWDQLAQLGPLMSLGRMDWMQGMRPDEWARIVGGWGRNTEGAKPWVEAILKTPGFKESVVQDMIRAGVTRDSLEGARDFYRSEAGKNPGAEQFKFRADGLDELLRAYPKTLPAGIVPMSKSDFQCFLDNCA